MDTRELLLNASIEMETLAKSLRALADSMIRNDPPRPRRRNIRYHDLLAMLGEHGVSVALLYELNYQQRQEGVSVPEVLEAHLQKLKNTGSAIPQQICQYAMDHLPVLQVMADRPRLRWTRPVERRMLDLIMISDAWETAYQMSNEFGERVSVGMVRGRVYNHLCQLPPQQIRRAFQPRQAEYLLRIKEGRSLRG